MLAEYGELAAGFAEKQHATADQRGPAGNLAALRDLDISARNPGIARDRCVDDDAAAGCVKIAGNAIGYGYAATGKQRVAIDRPVQIHLPARDQGITFHPATGRRAGTGTEVVAGNDGFVRPGTLLRCLADGRREEKQKQRDNVTPRRTGYSEWSCVFIHF